MDFTKFVYLPNSNRAVSDAIPAPGTKTLYSLSYPQLAKSVSQPGLSSPNFDGTNQIILIRDADPPITVSYAEGLPTIAELQLNINQAIVDAYPAVAAPLFLEGFGLNQLRWSNQDVVTWTINYKNAATAQLISGLQDLSLLIILSGSKGPIMNTDSLLGLKNLFFEITGLKFSIPASGSYLDGQIYYLQNLIDVEFRDIMDSRLSANFASLNTEQVLISPRNENMILEYLI